MKKWILKKWIGFEQSLISVINLQVFQQQKKENRKEIINLVKFQFEVIIVGAVIFGLFKDFFLSYFTDFPRTIWTFVGLSAYVFQIVVSFIYIFFGVVYSSYMLKKELYEVTLNVSTFVIFFEIISSITLLFFLYFGTDKVFEILVSIALALFVFLVNTIITLELILDKEKMMSEQQNGKKR